MKKMKKYALLVVSSAMFVTIAGCASLIFAGSTAEIWQKGNPATFASKKSALMLANCIDRNGNYSWGGTQKSTMRQLDKELFEVVRAGAEIISVVVQVKPVDGVNGGSRADFRFNGFDVGIASHVSDLTKGCE